MKKFLMIAVLVAALTAAFATSAFAAPVAPATPVLGTQAGSGYSAGNGFAGNGAHTPGTGLVNGQAQGMGARRGAPEWAGDNDDATSLLGLTVEQLQAERLAGKSLVQIAATKGIDENTLVVKLLDARKVTVNELLSAGKITQAQADYMLSNMAEHVKLQVERTNVGRPAFAGQSPTAGTRGGRWNR